MKRWLSAASRGELSAIRVEFLQQHLPVTGVACSCASRIFRAEAESQRQAELDTDMHDVGQEFHVTETLPYEDLIPQDQSSDSDFSFVSLGDSHLEITLRQAVAHLLEKGQTFFPVGVELLVEICSRRDVVDALQQANQVFGRMHCDFIRMEVAMGYDTEYKASFFQDDWVSTSTVAQLVSVALGSSCGQDGCSLGEEHCKRPNCQTARRRFRAASLLQKYFRHVGSHVEANGYYGLSGEISARMRGMGIPQHNDWQLWQSIRMHAQREGVHRRARICCSEQVLHVPLRWDGQPSVPHVPLVPCAESALCCLAADFLCVLCQQVFLGLEAQTLPVTDLVEWCRRLCLQTRFKRCHLVCSSTILPSLFSLCFSFENGMHI